MTESTGVRMREAIAAATATLAGAGIDSARTDAELLAAHVAGISRGRLTVADGTGDGFLERYTRAVEIRAGRVPLQHITGTAAFGPIELEVGPGVFIPRPETEAVLEWAAAQDLPQPPVIVDLCTGSGALAIALAACHPRARVVAIDDDPDALRYARRNAAATQAVQVLECDVTDVGLLPELDGNVDLVVSNPPYLPHGAELEPEVALHDPRHALFGGPDGMAVIRPIAGHAARWLKDGGWLAIEHDDSTSAETVRLITATGAFDDVLAHCDLTGRPRFVTARRAQRR
jgi:release factor glutamine methyltransferase